MHFNGSTTGHRSQSPRHHNGLATAVGRTPRSGFALTPPVGGMPDTQRQGLRMVCGRPANLATAARSASPPAAIWSYLIQQGLYKLPTASSFPSELFVPVLTSFQRLSTPQVPQTMTNANGPVIAKGIKYYSISQKGLLGEADLA
ncbi:hypothetical protein E4U42_007655 [Claviceps africana]|uniref:Uncharacterized protein n=1 Tax=Claviceps africana TaxID=83212 RepID=A0A8K0J1I9_9HYPO|nr:hypothetical protein E4U42_007655 [Claviceps africana]